VKGPVRSGARQQCDVGACTLSVFARKIILRARRRMSALTRIADSNWAPREVRKVPLPDSCAAAQDLQGAATIAKLVNIALLNSEAVEEPIPAGAAEVALAATARVHSESCLATFSYAHPRR
jgi:hypothetical protein